MSEIKHTPGPWHFDTDKKGYGCEFSGFAVHSERYTVATVITDTELLANAANARLIAAAPELLEALLEIKEHGLSWDDRYDDVIAKATGA